MKNRGSGGGDNTSREGLQSTTQSVAEKTVESTADSHDDNDNLKLLIVTFGCLAAGIVYLIYRQRENAKIRKNIERRNEERIRKLKQEQDQEQMIAQAQRQKLENFETDFEELKEKENIVEDLELLGRINTRQSDQLIQFQDWLRIQRLIEKYSDECMWRSQRYLIY